jgi:hypothetical protein
MMFLELFANRFLRFKQRRGDQGQSAAFETFGYISRYYPRNSTKAGSLMATGTVYERT